MTVRLAMSYAEVEIGDIDDLVRDEDVVFEQKFDGTRVLAVIKTGEPVCFLQRSGKVLAHTAATQHLDKLRAPLEALVGSTPGELVVDGELMIHTGEYHLFDVPYVRFGGMEYITSETPYYRRRAALNVGLIRKFILDGTKIKVTYQAETRREKQALLDAVRDAGGEGIMAKHQLHPYLPGRRTKRAVKLKFVKTADVIVTAVHRPDAKHGNFKLGAYRLCTEEQAKAAYEAGGTTLLTGGQYFLLAEVGGASAIGKDESIAVGDVVEVAYLYHTGTSLYQPRVIRKRTDKTAAECTVDQFPPYSRETITLSDE